MYIENIRAALVKHDPANAETLHKNAAGMPLVKIKAL